MARLKTRKPARKHKLLIKLAPDIIMGQELEIMSLYTHKIESPLAWSMASVAKSCSFSISGTSNIRLPTFVTVNLAQHKRGTSVDCSKTGRALHYVDRGLDGVSGMTLIGRLDGGVTAEVPS